MTVFQALILGLLQGLTEFLPVSSSGHLVLAQRLMNVNIGGADMLFDLTLHLGTLFAVCVAFRKQIAALFKRPFKTLLYLIVATIPAALAGLLLGDLVDEVFFGGAYLALGFALSAALLAAAILLCASGCGPKRESAQAVVEQAINAVQEMDTEAMPAYWGGSLLDDALTSEDADADAAYTAEMLDLLTDKLDYTITGSEEDEDAGTATVSVTFTNADLSPVMEEFLTHVLTLSLGYAFTSAEDQPSQEELSQQYMDILTELLRQEDLEVKEFPVEIGLTLTDDAWQITDGTDAVDAMLGGLITYFNELADDLDQAAQDAAAAE